MSDTARDTALRLYELAGDDPGLRFSPHCWKVRMALAHKGLSPECVPWHFAEKDAIAFSGQGLVPVLVAGETVVSDSFRIAEYLEAAYPERPTLFGGEMGRATARFINAYADTLPVPLIARTLLMDIHDRLAPGDRPYFRQSREKRFGMTLEQAAADAPARIEELRRILQPLRLMLKAQPFLSGAEPAYADYCLFGMFMWARVISPTELLAEDDPVHAWRAALLDAFDGFARAAPTAGARAA
ncbi:glutathione S-transferase family protein [Aquabacter cavernae]|uniref:glutathione S-transferase family protein n=1 Tax=Aquabacter cavernae TaxID=2496029 RepID=UPI000F8D6A9C|nr:glutathione S-transferase family protein [Aquabacter cavernae]